MAADTKENEYKPNPPEMDGVPDMTTLLYLEEPNVIHNLKIRFEKKLVYTEIGSILLSINPYEWVKSLYGDACIKNYSDPTKQSSAKPHCYKIASRALEMLKATGRSQSVLICGESGSGKTESSKSCIDLLVKSRKSLKHKGLANQIISVNPILEAFGNAKTVRNNNSSRFGKFTKIFFTPFDRNNSEESLSIEGCRIESYLLEKSRVVAHEPLERNFHIFYCLFHSSNKALGLSDPAKFKYLAATPAHRESIKLEGFDDAKEYRKLCEAMELLGLDSDTVQGLEKLIASILHLGNVEMEENDKGFSKPRADSEKCIGKAAELVELKPEALRKRLTTRKIKIGMEVIESSLSLDEANVNRETIAKSLFSSIFDWIFLKVNEFFNLAKDSDFKNVGILDIFGFEAFPRNSFEQFCINYANERLQQIFSESLMIAEQNEYIKEGVFWIPLEIPNNDEIVRLFSANQVGIFYLLEAACNMPKGTSSIFVANAFSSHRKNKKLRRVKMSKGLKSTLKPKEVFNGFQIEHFAEDVTYNCNEFLEKNKDLISAETETLFASSSSSILKKMFEPKSTKRKKSSKKNIGKVFLDSLEKLVKGFDETDQHFIRCINPNTKKSNKIWEVPHVTEQLRSSGIIPVLKVVKKGYPTRILYEDLEKNYRSLVSHPLVDNLGKNQFWMAILAGFGFPNNKYKFGLTKIFFKASMTFIQDLKKQNGPLNKEQITRIKVYFVTKRFIKLRGIVTTYIRLKNYIQAAKVKKVLFSCMCAMAAFRKPLEAIQAKLKFEREEVARLAREKKEREERLAREKKEREERLAREKKEREERLEKERKEKERIARDKKFKVEREAAEKLLVEERIAAEKRRVEEEKQRKIDEEKREIEEAKRAEEERIRLEKERLEEEERKRLEAIRKAEEAEKRRIAAMIAVRFLFEKSYAEPIESFNEKLIVELAVFFCTSALRYEVVLETSESKYTADVRIQDVTEEEEFDKYQTELRERHKNHLDADIQNFSSSNESKSADDSEEKIKETSATEKKPASIEESDEKTTNDSNTLEEMPNDSNSDNEDEKQADAENAKTSQVKRKKSFCYLTQIQLGIKLKKADFSNEDPESILFHLVDRMARNCEIVEEIVEEKQRKFSLTISKNVTKKKNPQELFIYSLSINSDALTSKFKMMPLLSDKDFFIKLVNDEYPEIEICHQDDNCLIVLTPVLETDVRVLVIPSEPISKSADGKFSESQRKIINDMALIAIEISEIKNLTLDHKVGVVMDHDKPNWTILRMMNYNVKAIANQLVHKSCEIYKDWMLQSISEEILCFSRINSDHLDQLRNSIFEYTNKTKKLITLLSDQNISVGQKSLIVKFFWLLQKFNYFTIAVKKNIILILMTQMVVSHTNYNASGSRKIFNRDDNDEIIVGHPAFLNHHLRNILKTLVFAAFYTKSSLWPKQITDENYTKMIMILRYEIENGDVRSDLTVNSVLFLLTSIKRSSGEFLKHLVDILQKNNIGDILKILLLKPTNSNYSEEFSMRVLAMISELGGVIPKKDYLKILTSMDDVFGEYATYFEGVNLNPHQKVLLDLTNTMRKTVEKASNKPKKEKKGFFKRLFK